MSVSGNNVNITIDLKNASDSAVGRMLFSSIEKEGNRQGKRIAVNYV